MLSSLVVKGRSRNWRGFTLIELLLVIAIIGLLSTVVLASLNSSRTKAKDSRRIQEIRELQKALELYYSENAFYPSSINSSQNNLGKYLTDDSDLLTGAGGDKYFYTGLRLVAGGTCQSYHLMVTLESVPAGTGLLAVDADATAAPLNLTCGTEDVSGANDNAACPGLTVPATGGCYDLKP